MAKLAIKGHETRGKEVIEILEMLGAKNCGLKGYGYNLVYYIRTDGYIGTSYTDLGKDYKVFTLEEFLEKFPYKVGDKVKVWVNGYRGVFDIQDIAWDSIAKEVKYKIRGCWPSARNLQPYKEETMKEIKIDIPDGYEFFGINDDNKVVLTKKQPRYPKTYEGCCMVLHDACMTHKGGYKGGLFQTLQKLLVCRDTYWKMAGEQMGLDKPWEPDWVNAIYTCTIICRSNRIVKDAGFDADNRILAFPTEEMRDAFYENFKDLIEECKEFL